jgi:threonine/homoserine/homoserine lactone efflux protein
MDWGSVVSIEFLLTSLVVVITPGTGVLYTMAAGLHRGVRASIIAAVGCTLGIIPHMVAAITGVAALLHTSAVAFQTLKYLGVAYLLYMAWVTWRDKGALTVEKDVQQRSATRVVVSGVLLNFLNPKLTIFFFAFLPQFVPADSAGAVSHMVYLSAVFMAVTLVVFSLYGVFAAAVRTKVFSRPRVVAWVRRSFGATYLVLAGRLAAQTR